MPIIIINHVFVVCYAGAPALVCVAIVLIIVLFFYKKSLTLFSTCFHGLSHTKCDIVIFFVHVSLLREKLNKVPSPLPPPLQKKINK